MNLIKNPISRFLVLLLFFYLGWYTIYNLWIHPAEKLDLFIIDITIAASKWLLELFGYTVFTGAERVIGVDGTGGLWIGDNCNAISLFALFAGFIIAYPGNWKKKLYFVPAGILLIELLNIGRVVALAILDTKSRTWTEFNHTYTFTIIIYACIFLLWMSWTNKISDKTFTSKTK
jgi:exosortase family protein XrtF